jgi:malonate decarboxylase alpha subunit
MVQSVLALPEHLDVFENGIASKLDFSFSGPQGARLAQLVAQGGVRIGAIHTYLELFARYFIDLTPQVALIAAHSADAQGNLYTGPNTEDTPAIVEATAFSGGIVIAQVNEIVDGCRASTCRPTGSTSSCRRRRRSSSSRCSRAIRRRSPRSRC